MKKVLLIGAMVLVLLDGLVLVTLASATAPPVVKPGLIMPKECVNSECSIFTEDQMRAALEATYEKGYQKGTTDQAETSRVACPSLTKGEFEGS